MGNKIMIFGAQKNLSLKGKTNAKFLENDQNQERRSFFFKLGKQLEYVRIGNLFRRKRSDKVIETAKVLSVYADSYGIPHVRFEIKMERAALAYSEIHGPRVLALKTFREIYKERIVH